ncbi:MAG TPA: FAD:protein FMN transferase, partial [Albitalea sp.]|nr:FAD:protein FMN transferase [Albitalea sp.]
MLRRARPLLGTLVEIGVPAQAGDEAVQAAFAAIKDVQSQLSRFEAQSDLGRFHALPAGGCMTVRAHTAAVLATAQRLRDASDGLFDISLRSAPEGWRIDGTQLLKHDAAVRLDLGGIGKGHAVDHAVDVLVARGCSAGWVNAGGDLRAFGDAELPITLRDERGGGARPFGTLRDGAFATSHFDRGSRSRAAAAWPVRAHV